jgi:lysophospholipase L1-like esterase
VIVHVLADGRRLATLVRPKPGLYRIDGLRDGRHSLRIEVASESQAGPTSFGGFFAPGRATPAPPQRRSRQIEFIGDSHTVGYGNRSGTRDCTGREVWETTDTSRAFGPRLARRYGADYQVNAISGRGVVRNYDGFAGDTLPVAYPYVLLDHRVPWRDPRWRPQLIVISLGTNDFSTPLKRNEKWRSRDALRADYEASYVRFVKQLRARNPRAYFILWAADSDAEVASESARVAQRLRAGGERRLAFVRIAGLDFSGCHFHPSVRDDAVIADRLAQAIDAQAPFGR